MANAVFYHKPDSIYDDDPADRYHFPKQYLSRVEQTVGDRIIFDGPIVGRKGRYYSATALVRQIRPDPNRANHFYADLEQFLGFDRPVDCTEFGGFEPGFVTETGEINSGYRVQAVRVIEPDVFARIVQAGLSEPDDWPDLHNFDEAYDQSTGLQDMPQSPLAGSPGGRPIVSQLVNRPFREAKFRQQIRKLYDRTCAFTGLQLINGGGRPEIDAAHIIPVENGGNDSVQNGLALSRTVHWMFDRGLLSLSDNYQILTSRQLNHDVSHLLHADMTARVPTDPSKRPHPIYLDWHRTNVFKH